MSEDKKPLLMIPGPIEVDGKILGKLAETTLSHTDPQLISAFGASLRLLRRVFGASSSSQAFILSGSGVLTWDAALCNLLQPNDAVLVLSGGVFGQRFADCAQAYDFKTHIQASASVGHAPDISAACQRLQEDESIRMVTVTHVDTSTGLKMDIQAVVSALRKVRPEILVVVDGVCASGGERLEMQAWDVDAVLTGSQKAFGLPPGLAIFCFSERALRVYHARTVPVRHYFASLKGWLPIMQAYEQGKPSYYATPNTNLVVALHAALLTMLPDEKATMQTVWEKQEKTGRAMHAAWNAMGLALVPSQADQASCVMSAVYLPENVKQADVLAAIKKRGAILAAGLHPEIKEKYIRMGHMGVSAMQYPQRQDIPITLDAVQDALQELGYISKEKASHIFKKHME